MMIELPEHYVSLVEWMELHGRVYVSGQGMTSQGTKDWIDYRDDTDAHNEVYPCPEPAYRKKVWWQVLSLWRVLRGRSPNHPKYNI